MNSRRSADDAFALEPGGDLVRALAAGNDDRLAAVERPRRVDLAVEQVGAAADQQHQQQGQREDAVEEAQERARHADRSLRSRGGAAAAAGASAPAVPRGCARRTPPVRLKIGVQRWSAGWRFLMRPLPEARAAPRAAHGSDREFDAARGTCGECTIGTGDSADRDPSLRSNVAKGRCTWQCAGPGVAALMRSPADGDGRPPAAAARSEALVPPKPNELDSTVSISRFCALCGTRSMAVSTEGLSRLSVGGAMLSRMASTEKIASTAPGRAQQMADRRLGGRHGELAGGVAEQPLDGGELDLVAHRRRGAVRVDVVDVARLEAGALQRHAHAAVGAVAVLGRRGDVIGVARQAVADHLGIDARAARLGVLQLFQHDDAGALAHDEAVAVLVVGARGLRAAGR